MKKQRLLKLADLMDTIADGRKRKKADLPSFYMSAFIVSSDDCVTNLSCNSQACALGSAAVSGIFERQGLHVGAYHHGINMFDVNLETRDGRVYRNFDAAAELFGITEAQAQELFADSQLYGREQLPEGARGARRVAKEIREFVARGGLPKRNAEGGYVR